MMVIGCGSSSVGTRIDRSPGKSFLPNMIKALACNMSIMIATTASDLIGAIADMMTHG
jgi:hypothetical protein